MSKKILLINKTASNLTSYRLLASAGYEVDMVRNSEVGLQQLVAYSYDIIIVQESYELTSWQLCEKIRCLSRLPLIFINPNATADACVDAINAGADYFIRKAFGPLELLARVRSLIQRIPAKQPTPVG